MPLAALGSPVLNHCPQLCAFPHPYPLRAQVSVIAGLSFVLFSPKNISQLLWILNVLNYTLRSFVTLTLHFIDSVHVSTFIFQNSCHVAQSQERKKEKRKITQRNKNNTVPSMSLII